MGLLGNVRTGRILYICTMGSYVCDVLSESREVCVELQTNHNVRELS